MIKNKYLLVSFVFVLSACSSTSNKLPTDNIDIQYYPNQSVKKKYPESNKLTVITSDSSIPKEAVFLGTIEIIKILDECATADTCNNSSTNTHNSNEYIDYYAKRMGATISQEMEHNKIRVRQKEEKYCIVEREGCNLDNTRFTNKQVCFAGVCRTERVISGAHNCKETCREYGFKKLDGFIKTERTIAKLYRQKS